MVRGDKGTAIRDFDAIFSVGTLGGLADAQLLELFRSRRDEAAELAFATLVERHGPMVLRTCRALLRDSHDAHDAFQATFLVLVRRAGSLWVHDSLGPWLHQVALRTSSSARRIASRRRRHERPVAEAAALAARERDDDGLGTLLHDEVSRLPGRYRAAVVLCLLEGMTPEQAALQLHCPIGTVHSRLARGRERLRDRLTRRGLAPPTVQTAAVLAPEEPRSAVPISLMTSTVGAATRAMAGKVTAGTVPVSITRMTQGVMRMILLARLKLAAALILTIGVVAIGAGIRSGRGTGESQQPEGPANRSQPDVQPRSVKPQEPLARAKEKDGGVTKETLIDGLLARSTEVKSGRIEYYLKVEIAGRVIRDSDYRFSFSGEEWAELDLRSKRARFNHDGRLLTYTESPQADGRISRSITLDFSESPFKHQPYPPVQAGTLWNSSTAGFVRERASKGRLLGMEDVNGVETLALEWDVEPQDRFRAFHSINNMLQEGGKLRLYVARQLGYALPRIEHIDRFGTVQRTFDHSGFQEVAPRVFFPTVCRVEIGSHKQEYRLTKFEKINDLTSGDDFIPSIPADTSVSDQRAKSTDKVDRDGKRSFSLQDYPFRQFRASAPYPRGFPPELLKELDRDVVKPTKR